MIEEGFPKNKIINGEYVIDELIGDGGMGLVYRAHDEDDERRMVVVKTLKRDALAKPYVVKHFYQEAEALGRISHDGVVKMFAHGEDRETGLPFIVMEYVKGLTLTAVIERGPMEAEKCAQFVMQIAQALTAVHEVEIYHRDLKPDNLIVTEREHEPDRIKLIDFGVARVPGSRVGKTTVGNPLVGTFDYLSPEQVNLENPTVQSEVFSLATVAYQMLARMLAFPLYDCENENEATARLRELHKKGHKPLCDLRRDLPEEVNEVFKTGLALDPRKRFQTPIKFAAALKAALDRRALPPPPTVYTPRSRWKRVRRRLATLAAALLLLLALALILYYAFGPE
jgi:serine/threonine protein kinase